MKTVSHSPDIQTISKKLKSTGKTIGFVPTMGFLHEGHLSLIRESKKRCDITVVSIFVNPTQFGPTEDFNKYPRDVERDNKFLEDEGVDFLFLPSTEEIYPKDFQTYVNVEYVTKKLEGEFRPTHFRGVATVVLILFNSVQPDFAFFGQKDAQQLAVIKQMVKDLKLDVKIVSCPIVREPDGLAMSSRNVYLSASERKDALVLFHSLQKAKKLISAGETRVSIILSELAEIFTRVSSASLDYIKIVEADTFEIVDELIKGKSYYILIACKIGKTRLIDNILITL
ncbi:MAG: pantoate--beta-alanine ligase [Ignavibacteriaceae bacterium]|nr:pantoate--beta-alanine ligase [Ignavibacteriaceae bacterium]